MPTKHLDPRDLTRQLGNYRAASSWRASYELGITLVLFCSGGAAGMWALSAGAFWLYLPSIMLMGGAVVRLFMVQHDCGHGSFFPGRTANDWVGRALAVLTWTPYDLWKHAHNLHHAHSGNLDERGFGDVVTLTVAEYLARSPSARLRYRLYRHPLVMFGIGPIYTFVISHRLPLGFMDKGRGPWMSAMLTNAGIAALLGTLMTAFGPMQVLLVYGPAMWLAATVGVWLFFVQHQFEETTWKERADWTFHETALYGSSYLALPAVLNWFSANIGVHHVHHLASRIPFYRLPEVLADFPDLRQIGRVTLWQSFACMRLTLWDESVGRMIAFSDLDELEAVSPFERQAAE